MTKPWRLLAGLVCILVLGGCGSATDKTDGSSAAGHSTAPSTSPTVGGAVVSVSLRRSGGLKPVAFSRVFSAGHAPPRGFSKADVTDVIRAAQALVAAAPKIRPLPANTCCDRSTYIVSIVLSDGTTKTFASVDGLNQPRLFDKLLSRLA
jgi:hypothetical protein